MFSTPFVLTFSLLLSLPILFFLAPRILPPRPHSVHISPSDELDDVNLFNRAITQSHSNPKSKSNPSKFFHLSSKNPNLKIAFLFLTNSDLHFAPLWDRFFQNNPTNLYNIYIHADPSVNVTRPDSPVFRGKFIAAKRTYRASPTLISATRRLLATALLDDPANAYFAVLSQYCIPLHSFNYIYHSLFVSPTFDLTDPESTQFGVRLKYKSFVEILSNAPKLWKRYVARGRYAMTPEVPFEKFRVGSQFFTLARRHALVVIKDRSLWRKFKIPCYREDECYPEEHYFPTLLSMADPDGCTKYTLTRVNWTGTVNGHPYTYRPAEVSPELISRLRQSNHSESYLFARKFTPDCLEPLMRIAKSVIFRD
ncbi:glycosyltransferase BC10-like [Gastrolobium bilobum]|uniref:glycosyltransferase BC10-like n=1 Tax=Gastrolobium bilobum TaxID=150636 RepID=UPI002AB30152|nr:glycosyltransferase BC10-like [Gastrolobium bilobum]